MKHTGGCLCGQYKFETELDPMLIIQCNCSKCRKLSGSYQIGCLYSEDEIQESGETEVYEFAGGTSSETEGKTKSHFAQSSIKISP